MSFVDAMNNTLNHEYNYNTTENGALGYRTSGKQLLDLNFSVPSMRTLGEDEIYSKFLNAYYENKELAILWLFFVRDARGGLGERRTFRAIFKKFSEDYPDIARKLLPLISEYGRYDDMWELLCNDKINNNIFTLVEEQLSKDMKDAANDKPISLLAKWMPSENTSSVTAKSNAYKFMKAMDVTPRQYRKMLSKLRKYLDVVENKMSRKQWNEINYGSVPSKANIKYMSAFMRNDTERRQEYLAKLDKGEVKINASVLYPHDIVHKYCTSGRRFTALQKDDTLENLWKSLPSCEEIRNTIVVCDGSGSMYCTIGGTQVTALEVSNALAVYFAQYCTGEFYNKFITFSSRPQLVDLNGCDCLNAKLNKSFSHSECSNTNIEAVFDLILTTAVKNKMKQEDIPSTILIVSDMEFDNATYGPADKRLFDKIKERYNDACYSVPKLVFWNVNSRTGTIPVIENDRGVALVSGFSTALSKMIMNGKTDPYECLVETLMSERYKPVRDALS